MNFNKFKKHCCKAIIFVLLICFTFSFSIFNTSAAYSTVTEIQNSWNYQLTDIWRGSSTKLSYYTSPLTEHDPFTSDSYVGDFVGFYPNTIYSSYHFGFDFPTSFSSGQILTVSGKLLVSSNTTSLTVNFGDFSNTNILTTNYKVYNELSGSYYYYIPFSVTFNVNSYNLPYLNRVFFSVTSSSDLYFIGVADINLQINTDTAGLLENFANNINSNQDSNTDKIINGGHDSPQYDDFSDSDIIDESTAAEQEAQDGASAGASEYSNFGDTVSNLFSGNGSIFKGVQAVSFLLSRLVYDDWVNNLLVISLYLGIFSFVVGSVSGLVKKARNSSKNKP